MDQRDRFEAVVRAEAQKVFNLAYRLCGDRERARDLAQETFFRAWRSFDRFEGRAAMFTYLYRITCNLWKNSLRRKGFYSLTENDSDGTARAREIPVRAADFSADLRREERNQIIQVALNNLEPAEKAIVVLRDIEGRSYEEITAVLGCRPGTVKSRLARARRKLADKLAPHREALG